MSRRFAEIGREWTFQAAHHLPNHQGKCRRVHGHSYRCEVALWAQIREVPDAPDEGMVLDYGSLDEMWAAISHELDHRDLNETLDIGPTTAENIAGWVADRFLELLPTRGVEYAQGHAAPRLTVTVRETSSSRATVQRWLRPSP